MELPKISQPAMRALTSINVKSLEDIMKYSEEELLALHGFGPKSIRILRKEMDAHGMKFKNEE
ncbi:DNA-directed RNA polymerase subunit alpha C-terminal domain-containing protein [Macrococcus sp. EM39E]|uniref:DNA-directed RNA polymerase subunit alpha C-terminal domain-containing protein n=1 Tax=Macrococcus animalis TaxID=3395467 RepID=UPI0039BE3B0C